MPSFDIIEMGKDPSEFDPVEYFWEHLRVSGVEEWEPVVAAHMADEMLCAFDKPTAGDIARLNSAALCAWVRFTDLRAWHTPEWLAKA